MTAEEFEAAYAARSGVTVEELRAAGRVVVACACGDGSCEGWKSVSGADQVTRRLEDARAAARAWAGRKPVLAEIRPAPDRGFQVSCPVHGVYPRNGGEFGYDEQRASQVLSAHMHRYHDGVDCEHVDRGELGPLRAAVSAYAEVDAVVSAGMFLPGPWAERSVALPDVAEVADALVVAALRFGSLEHASVSALAGMIVEEMRKRRSPRAGLGDLAEPARAAFAAAPVIGPLRPGRLFHD